MTDQIEETTFHLLSVAGLIPPQPYRHDLVPSFECLPKIANRSVFDLLARKNPGSVIVSDGSGVGGGGGGRASTTASSTKSGGEGLGRPKSTDVAGLGGGKGKEKESGWNKFQ